MKNNEDFTMLKYKFTQEDLQFVKNLIGDTMDVFLRDNDTTMDTRPKKNNKYIESISIYFTSDFIKEVDKYFLKVGKLTWNNTRSCWWMFFEEEN